MSQAILEHVAKSSLKKNPPDVRVGQTVRVHQKIREGAKERIQIFEGLVIATNGGKGINGTFTVRKIVDSIGVEKIFPLHGGTLPKVEVTKQAKIRRSKLYYMRELQGKAARLKETHLKTMYDENAAKQEAEAEVKAAEEAAQKAEAEEKETETPATANAKTEEVKEEVKEEIPVEESKSDELEEEKKAE